MRPLSELDVKGGAGSWGGANGIGRTIWWAAVAALLLAVGASCGEDADSSATSSAADASTSSSLAGTWQTVPGFDDVTMTLDENGTFDWENRSLGALGKTSGTWTADANTLTFTFDGNGRFCPGETLTWSTSSKGTR